LTTTFAHSRRNISLLAFCQAMMMTGNSLLVATSALVGMALATNKGLATLPLALQFLATMLTTIPASMLMRRIGRRAGFMMGCTIGLFGAVTAALAIRQHSFLLFCLGTVLLGSFNGFAVFYRFAATECVEVLWRGRAISYVLAGGVVAAFLGPNLANWSREWGGNAEFAGSYAMLVCLYLLSMAALVWLRIGTPTLADQHKPARPLRVIALQPGYAVAVIGGMIGYAMMAFLMSATPLAMAHRQFGFGDTAIVIQWHVLAMFAPSFLSGPLIDRFGAPRLMFAGGLLLLATIAVNLLGEAFWHFWSALFLLGVAWNFLFVGATTLVAASYRESERAKAQALNDFLVLTVVSLATLSSGWMLQQVNWIGLNLLALPFAFVALAAVGYLLLRRKPAFAETV
jgi:MFS family permease